MNDFNIEDMFNTPATKNIVEGLVKKLFKFLLALCIMNYFFTKFMDNVVLKLLSKVYTLLQ